MAFRDKLKIGIVITGATAGFSPAWGGYDLNEPRATPTVTAEAKSREGNAKAGRAYAIRTCSACHVVSADQPPPLSPPVSGAPSFQDIANARTTTATGLNVFLVTPHRNMPNLILRDQDKANVIAYIMSLRGRV